MCGRTCSIYGFLNTLLTYPHDAASISLKHILSLTGRIASLSVRQRERERKRQQEAINWHQQSLLGNVYPVGGCQLEVIYFLVDV